MRNTEKSLASTINKQSKVMTFQFSESKHEIRNLLIDTEPWFVAKDVCDVLEHTNVSVAIKMLDQDERTKQSLGRQGETWLVSESGLYALIMRSNKPEAKSFRKWVTKEVLPSIRKKGYYATKYQQKDAFVDARDVPFLTKNFQEASVRVINLNGVAWFSINDVHRALCCATGAAQIVKKLNAKQRLASKIWVFGNTHPAWFTNQLGVQLILSNSKKITNPLQLNLAI